MTHTKRFMDASTLNIIMVLHHQQCIYSFLPQPFFQISLVIPYHQVDLLRFGFEINTVSSHLLHVS